MNKEKRHLLDKTYQTFMDVGLGQNNLVLLVDIVAIDVFGFGTAVDEKISGLLALQELLKRQKKQTAGMGLRWKINTLDIHISIDEHTAIFTNEVTFYITNETEKIELYKRFSVVLEYVQNKWIIVHWHGSKPEFVESEKDTWGIKTWKEKAEALEMEVAEKTADLIEKNRELLIEAALEKVRATAIAMQKSEDLKKVVEILYGQLRNLGFQFGVASITIMDPNTGDMDWWMEGIGDGYVLPERYHVPFFDHPGHLQQLEQWKNGTPYAEIEISGQEKKSYDAYYFFQTDFEHAPDSSKQLMMQAESVRFSMAFMKYGALSWSPTPLSKDQATILVQFAKVFEQCYTRFLDLQIAEAQTREAKIEAALERTRVKAMSIQSSNELKEIVKVVFDSLLELDFIIRDGAVSILVFEKGSKDHIQWIADPDHVFPAFKVEFSNHSLLTDIISGWENGSMGYQKIYPYKEKREYFEFLFEHNPDYNATPLEIKNLLLESREYGYSIAFRKHSALSVATNIGKLLSQSEFEILRRFSIVFDQAYTRFLDILKAEAQTREAQIEAALEKVRSTSLAMHRSDELEKVVMAVSDRLTELGFQFDGALIFIFDSVKRNITLWIATNQLSAPLKVHLPFDTGVVDNAIWKTLWNAIDTGEHVVNKSFSGNEKDDYFKYVQKYNTESIPPPIRELELEFPIWSISMATEKNAILAVDSWSDKLISEEEFQILIRFARVFEQAYTRFLDLQKAEAQAREAQIEAALEKIRSQSLVMHHSGELRDVITVFFDKLIELGALLGTVGIALFDKKSKDISYWVGNSIQDPQLVAAPFDETMMKEDNFISLSWKAMKEQTEIINVVFPKEQKDRYFEHLFAHNDLIQIPKSAREVLRKMEKHTVCFIPNHHAALFVDSWDGKQYTDDDIAILRRAGKVFEQAYVRFLDLQKAEAQAREAQIEAALEKIRSRSLAMHHSGEIPEVIATMFEKLRELKAVYNTIAIQLFDFETKNSIFWAGNNLQEVAPKVLLPFDQKMMDADTCHRDLWRAMEKGEVIFNKVYTKQQKDQWFEYVFAHNDSTVIEEHSKEFIRNAEIHTVCFVPVKNAGLFADTWDGTKFQEEDLAVLIRVAKVFDQAYTRFLDLKKAEAQAREAKIEAALEKVRSRSLAMHKSSELKEVIIVVFEKLKEVGLVFEGAGIQLFTEGSKDIMQWVAAPDHLAAPILAVLPYTEEDYKESEIVRDMWMAKEKGENVYNKSYSINEKDKFFKYAGRYNDFDQIPVSVREFQMQAPGYTLSLVAERRSALWTDSYFGQTISEEGFNVLKRTAKVFDQAYTRFLDLEKAEAQARESQIEAALERVRSRSMAMHASSEILEVAHTMYEQLKQLGFDYGGNTIMIMDKETGDMEWWMAGLGEGKFPEVYKISYFDHPIQNQILEDWKSGKDFAVIPVEGDLKQSYDEELFTRNGYKDLPDHVKIWMRQRKSVVFSLAYMNHGVLHWGPDELSTEQGLVLQRFAHVFDQVYTRFLDLQKVEAQAREATIEVALERIRAKALAMQTSDELIEVAKVLREQMGLLGQEDLEASVVHLYYPDSPVFDSWYAIRPIGKDSREIISGIASFKIDNSELAREFFKLYEDPTTEYTLIVQGEKQKEWLEEIRRNAPEVAAYWGDLPPEKQYYHFSDFSGGALLMVSYKTLSEETKMLQKRCSAVFELAYKRFQDLQQKEKQAKELLEEKQRLERALDKLKSTQALLIQSEKMASLGELTAGIAHEIQNPLNFVNNFSEVSAELVDEIKETRAKVRSRESGSQESRPKTEEDEVEDEILEDIKQNLVKINHHGKRADAIVKGMLEHSRTSSGERVLTDINALVDEYLRLSYHGMRAKDKSFNADFKTEFDANLHKINVVQQDIGRVILNIINNAFQAVGTALSLQPMVIVSTKNLGNAIEISVKDNGPGIPDSIKDKIFQPFFTTKPTGQGTGLGLSLSYDIVKAHNGELKVKSNEGEGAEFIFALPLKPN